MKIPRKLRRLISPGLPLAAGDRDAIMVLMAEGRARTKKRAKKN